MWGFSWASFWVAAGRCCGQLTGLPRRRPRIYRLASKRLPPNFSLSNKHSHRTTRRPSKPSHRSRRRPNDYPIKLERWTANLMPFSSPLRALSSNLPLLRNLRQHPQKEGADASDFEGCHCTAFAAAPRLGQRCTTHEACRWLLTMPANCPAPDCSAPARAASSLFRYGQFV